MKITPEMEVEEVVRRYPRTVPIFYRHGLPALACGEAIWGTIAENAAKHNIKELETLLRELNRAAGEENT